MIIDGQTVAQEEEGFYILQGCVDVLGKVSLTRNTEL